MIKTKKRIHAEVIGYRDRVECERKNLLADYIVFGSCYHYPGVEFIIHKDEIEEFSKAAWYKRISG